MKKKNFVSLLFGTVGGILFALGMCMCLLPEWGAFTPGVVIAAVGAVVLLVLLLVRRKMAGKPAVHISGKAVGAVLLGIVGALVLGVGMCMAMVWGMLVPGIVMGVAGILSISKRLGHARVSTTTDIYSHLIAQADEAASECIADAVLRKKA